MTGPCQDERRPRAWAARRRPGRPAYWSSQTLPARRRKRRSLSRHGVQVLSVSPAPGVPDSCHNDASTCGSKWHGLAAKGQVDEGVLRWPGSSRSVRDAEARDFCPASALRLLRRPAPGRGRCPESPALSVAPYRTQQFGQRFLKPGGQGVRPGPPHLEVQELDHRGRQHETGFVTRRDGRYYLGSARPGC